MKTNIKLLTLSLLLLTGVADAKNTPLSPSINSFFPKSQNSYEMVTPVNLIRPVSLTIDEDIDFREMFSMLYDTRLFHLDFTLPLKKYI